MDFGNSMMINNDSYHLKVTAEGHSRDSPLLG